MIDFKIPKIKADDVAALMKKATEKEMDKKVEKQVSSAEDRAVLFSELETLKQEEERLNRELEGVEVKGAKPEANSREEMLETSSLLENQNTEAAQDAIRALSIEVDRLRREEETIQAQIAEEEKIVVEETRKLEARKKELVEIQKTEEEKEAALSGKIQEDEAEVARTLRELEERRGALDREYQKLEELRGLIYAHEHRHGQQ